MARLDELRFLDPPGGHAESAIWCRGPVEQHTSAVLLVHDRAANVRMWDLVMRRLPSGVAVIAVDLRGRGAAWRHHPSAGVTTHVVDLIAHLDHYDVDEVLAVGHGFGAAVCSELARLAPERVPLTLGILGDGRADPFDAVLGLAFSDRLEHLAFWQQHARLQRADAGALQCFASHGIAGPADHHRWRVDVRSLVADDHSLAAIPHVDWTRSVHVGSGLPNHVGGSASTATLVDHDPAAVLLTPAGADAVAAQVRLLLG